MARTPRSDPHLGLASPLFDRAGIISLVASGKNLGDAGAAAWMHDRQRSSWRSATAFLRAHTKALGFMQSGPQRVLTEFRFRWLGCPPPFRLEMF